MIPPGQWSKKETVVWNFLRRGNELCLILLPRISEWDTCEGSCFGACHDDCNTFWCLLEPEGEWILAMILTTPS